MKFSSKTLLLRRATLNTLNHLLPNDPPEWSQQNEAISTEPSRVRKLAA